MTDFDTRIARINDVLCAVNALEWDARVMMPPGGAETRGHQVATLKGLAREMILDPALADAAASARDSADARTRAAGDASVTELCEIAAKRGLMVDMHCDETDDPMSRHIETLCRETLRLGLQGRVAASHLTSMHVMDNYYASKLIPLIAESEITVIPSPLTNIAAWGKNNGSYPKWRGITRVPELLEADVTVAFGQDCVMDPWYAYGCADMLEVAHMGSHITAMFGVDQVSACFDAITVSPAQILLLEDYGLDPGCHADMIVLQAADPLEAIRLKARRLAVIRRGKIIARTAPTVTELSLPGRPNILELTYRPV